MLGATDVDLRSATSSHGLGRTSCRLGRSRRKQHRADCHRQRHEHQSPYAHYRVVVAMTARHLRRATSSVTRPGHTMEIAGSARFARGHVRFSLPTCPRRRKDCQHVRACCRCRSPKPSANASLTRHGELHSSARPWILMACGAVGSPAGIASAPTPLRRRTHPSSAAHPGVIDSAAPCGSHRGSQISMELQAVSPR